MGTTLRGTRERNTRARRLIPVSTLEWITGHLARPTLKIISQRRRDATRTRAAAVVKRCSQCLAGVWPRPTRVSIVPTAAATRPLCGNQRRPFKNDNNIYNASPSGVKNKTTVLPGARLFRSKTTCFVTISCERTRIFMAHALPSIFTTNKRQDDGRL